MPNQTREQTVSVVIPNFNGENYLRDCLNSLAEQSFKKIEIIVVDNASTDRSKELLAQEFPQVRLIRLASNRGFAAAVNKGIEAAHGAFIILLNNDTRVERDFVRELRSALVNEPAASMAAPKILFLRDPKIINSAGLGYCITGTNHDIGFGRADGPEFDRASWIFGPCGGAGIYRREVFDAVGGFDEDFFMYYEDVDFSFRAQLKGYKCLYVPTAVVYHAEGGSSSRLSRPKNFFFARNSALVVIKDFPFRTLLKYFPLIKWEMAKRSFSPLLKGDASALSGYFSAVKLLGKFLRKRRAVQKDIRVSVADIEKLLNRNRSIKKEIDIHGRPCEGRL